MTGGDELMVIADICTDDTARVALQAGATVYRRENGKAAGKGAALAWFVKYYWNMGNQFTRIATLDADSLLSMNFFVPYPAGDLADGSEESFPESIVLHSRLHPDMGDGYSAGVSTNLLTACQTRSNLYPYDQVQSTQVSGG
jgi:hypothetical protein